MKLNKLCAVAFASLALTACSDYKDMEYPDFLGSVNTAAGVTVSLPSTLSVYENQTVFNVPVEVTGETNGKVVVNVQVKEITVDGTEPAKPVENFNITSTTVNIPAGEAKGSIECTNVWEQGVINKDRTFEITILSAEGATVSSQKTCIVTIVNSDDAYTMLLGQWKMSAETLFEPGGPVEYNLTMKTPDPTDEYYGKELYLFGLLNYDFLYVPLSYSFDEETGKVSLAIMPGEFATTSTVKFNGIGDCVLVSQNAYLPQQMKFGEPIELTLNEEKTEITAPEDAEFFLSILPYPALNSNLGYLDGWNKIKFTR